MHERSRLLPFQSSFDESKGNDYYNKIQFESAGYGDILMRGERIPFHRLL